MGVKLVRYYKLVEEKGGMAARMRMALRTSIPSNEADSTPDSQEWVQRFYEVAKEIIGPDAPKL